MPRRVEDAIAEPLGTDLVALAQCHALYASSFPRGAPPAVLAGGPPSIWIVRSDAGVAGFLGGTASSGVLYISSLAVDAAHRGSGFGRLLLRAATASARDRGLGAVRLHVSTGNGPAVELYVSEGFRAVQRRVRYYDPRTFPDGGDAWEMILRLSPTEISTPSREPFSDS
jgi:ribosomal protein S18 acetylase RimI-like enzyme